MASFNVGQLSSWEVDQPWNLSREDREYQRYPGFAFSPRPLGSETASYTGGRIILTPEFFDWPPGVRRTICYHEAGHAMLEAAGGMSAITEVTGRNALDIMDLPGAHSLSYNAEEVIAEAYSVLMTEPSWLHQYPEIESIITKVVRRARFPLTVSGGRVTSRTGSINDVYDEVIDGTRYTISQRGDGKTFVLFVHDGPEVEGGMAYDIGVLELADGPNGLYVNDIRVDYKREGWGTLLFEVAQSVHGPLGHSDPLDMTPAGLEWSKSVGRVPQEGEESGSTYNPLFSSLHRATRRLYHGTHRNNIKSIMEGGLRASQYASDQILSEDYDFAEHHASENHGANGVVIAFDVPVELLWEQYDYQWRRFDASLPDNGRTMTWSTRADLPSGAFVGVSVEGSITASTNPPWQDGAVHGAGEVSPGSWADLGDTTDISPGHVSAHGGPITGSNGSGVEHQASSLDDAINDLANVLYDSQFDPPRPNADGSYGYMGDWQPKNDYSAFDWESHLRGIKQVYRGLSIKISPEDYEWLASGDRPTRPRSHVWCSTRLSVIAHRVRATTGQPSVAREDSTDLHETELLAA